MHWRTLCGMLKGEQGEIGEKREKESYGGVRCADVDLKCLMLD
jgi:hypothetical protein